MRVLLPDPVSCPLVARPPTLQVLIPTERASLRQNPPRACPRRKAEHSVGLLYPNISSESLSPHLGKQLRVYRRAVTFQISVCLPK